LAGALEDLALAYDAAGKPADEPAYLASFKMYEALVKEFPDYAQYKVGLGVDLWNLGAYVAPQRSDQAEAYYNRGLEVLKGAYSADALRVQLGILNNLGEMRQNAGGPGAEEALRDALAVAQQLVAQKPAAKADLTYLAIVQNNLGAAATAAGRTQEAEQLYAASIAGFTRLRNENPKDINLQTYLGSVYEGQAQLWDKAGQLERARQSIEASVAHDQEAVKLTDGKVAVTASRCEATSRRWRKSAWNFMLAMMPLGRRWKCPKCRQPPGRATWTLQSSWRRAWPQRIKMPNSSPCGASRLTTNARVALPSCFARRSTLVPNSQKRSSPMLTSRLSSGSPSSAASWETSVEAGHDRVDDRLAFNRVKNGATFQYL
jgi:hypothetical protein